jgi:hypothetical protein
MVSMIPVPRACGSASRSLHPFSSGFLARQHEATDARACTLDETRCHELSATSLGIEQGAHRLAVRTKYAARNVAGKNEAHALSSQTAEFAPAWALLSIRSCDICEDILESTAGDDLRLGKICVLLHEVLNQSLHIGDVIVRS